MSVLGADVATVLLLILPGFLAYRFAVFRRADPVERSPLWQLSEILEYSVYVHVVGVGLLFLIHGLLKLIGIDSYLTELPSEGPVNFLNQRFITGSLLFTLYPVYVIVAAILMGAYDVPKWIGNGLLKGTTKTLRGASSLPLLGWIRPPLSEHPREPIWYLALHEFPQRLGTTRTLLLVRMKQGDIYHGELMSYPVLPDDHKEKDFLIGKARYYPGGDLDQEYRLDEVIDGVGAVLLNTADVDSIQVYYYPANGERASS